MQDPQIAKAMRTAPSRKETARPRPGVDPYLGSAGLLRPQATAAVCGVLANRLTDRGVAVTGLDATSLFLDLTRRDAASRGVDVDYVEGDVRVLPWMDERFDRVLSWFTSFGYFDDQDNRRVLHEAHRVLLSGRQTPHLEQQPCRAAASIAARFVTERDGHFAIDRSCFDPTTGRATRRMIIREGRTRRSCSPCACSWPPSSGTGCSTPDSPASISSERRPAYRTEPPYDRHRVLVEATVQRSRYSSSSVPIMDPRAPFTTQPTLPNQCPHAVGLRQER